MAGRFSIEAIFTGNDRLSRVVGQIGSSFTRMGQNAKTGMFAVSKANDKLFGSLSGIANKALKAGAALGTVAAVGIGTDAIKNAMDFEQAITNVGAVSLMTRNQIADLEAKATQLGRDTKFTATEAANAMELMGKAGFSNKQIIEGIDGVLAAAAAEGIGIEETASHVSNVLKGMGLDNAEMGANTTRVADVLTLASARTNSSISSLGESMSNVASTAKQLNVPLEQVVAGVALLQDVGLDASVAGSAMNTMLTQMATPSKTAAAEMKKWGISFKDAHGNMLPFQEVLGQLSKASAAAGGNFDQVAFFADLVGLRGQKAAANLKDLFNNNKYQDLAKELEGAAGSAAKMAAIRLDTSEGDLKLLKSSFEMVEIAATKTVLSGLRPMVKEATIWLNVNKDLIGQKAEQYLKSFAENLPTIVAWMGRLWNGVKVLFAISAGVKVITLATGAWNAVAAANPWVIAFGAILAASMLVVAFWPELKRFFDNHKFAVLIVTTAVIGLTSAMYGGAVAAGVVRNAQALLIAGHWAYSLAAKAASVANGGLGLSFSALLVPIAAVAAAAAAVLAVYDQVSKLQSETGGAGVTGTIGNMIEYGTLNPFKANDEAMNDAARHDAANRPQMVSPAARTAREISESNTNTTNTSELVIRDTTGKASFTKAPAKGSGITLAPSGGM